ncbi:MAG: aminoacyl-tRNA hydrolase [Mogibacterium sp.]|nr:aminoacyl-tRNA hydrolase [Mogibacterium sp.]
MVFFGKTQKKDKQEKFADDTFVIVGLGNPGKDYENTRHNMGFRALDVLASDTGIDVRRAKFHALIGQGKIAGKKVILVKPQTYMNNSGIAVREAAMYYDVPSCNVIVIYDDIDLPVASIRIRKSGGPGTHNGMKSVVQQLGVKDFARIRIGVGAAETGEDLVDRVIGKVPKSEQEILDKAAAEAAKAAYDIVAIGIDTAMNRHNHAPAKKKKEPAPESSNEPAENDNKA